MDPKAEELAAVVAEIRQRVRARHPNGTVLGDIPLPDLTALVHARDAAEGKVASIGTVNPRPAGPISSAIQGAKRMVARALDWHVREQVEFNRGVMRCVQSTLEALTEANRTMAALSARFAGAQEMAQQLEDIRMHWGHWRVEWEKKLANNEIVLLRNISELQAAFQHRVTLMDASFREQIQLQHANFEAALERASANIGQHLEQRLQHDLSELESRLDKDIDGLQKRFWADLEKIRIEYETLIHAELRSIRQRAAFAPSSPAAAPPAAPAEFEHVDWLKFAEKFRGSEDAIQARQQMYAQRFRGHAPMLDLGCGRGELLEVLRQAGIEARGIDMSEDCIALCHTKGLQAERADLFAYLNALPDSSLGGVISCQVVEHLPAERVPELVRLAHRKMRTGGLLAIETPNPECLAIFSTHFYLDPTHRHPIPPALMNFYFQEAGFGGIEVERLSPAIDSMPALAQLPEEFRRDFFGSLDYAAFARKLG